MQDVEPLRAAARSNPEAFLREHPYPVLLLKEYVPGQLQPRRGATPAAGGTAVTMVHVDNRTIEQKLFGEPPRERKRHDHPKWCPIIVPEGQSIQVGRSGSCAIRLDDDTVSSRHGRILARAAGRLSFVDDGSTNGSWMDGAFLEPNQVAGLHSGVELQLGAQVLLFLGPEDFLRYLTRWS